MNVRFSNRAFFFKLHVFLVFVVSTAWVTLLYVVGFAGRAGRHKYWSDREGEPRFGAGGDFRFGSTPAGLAGRHRRQLSPQ